MNYEEDFLRVKGIDSSEDSFEVLGKRLSSTDRRRKIDKEEHVAKMCSILFPGLEEKFIAHSSSFEEIYKGVGDALKQIKESPTHRSFRDLFKGAADDLRAALLPVDEDRIALQYAKEREKELELLPDVVSCSSTSYALTEAFEPFMSHSLNVQYRLDADYGDLTAHRPPSERENKFKNPLGNDVALERERKKRTKHKVIKGSDKTNDTDPVADIPLLHTFDKRDPLTGLIPFEDNGARRRKPKKGKSFKYRGAGGGKPGRDMRDLSTRAVEQDSIYSEDRSLSGVPIEAEGRRFLLPKVLPMLTKHQREILAKAFMRKDKDVIRSVLELVDQAYLDLIE